VILCQMLSVIVIADDISFAGPAHQFNVLCISSTGLPA